MDELSDYPAREDEFRSTVQTHVVLCARWLHDRDGTSPYKNSAHP